MNDERTLIEERCLPEREGVRGSKTTSIIDGSILKTTSVCFCDSCGQVLKGEKMAICSCNKKICPICMVIHENKTYCKECAKRIAGLTKDDFFILYGLANGANLKVIRQASSISSQSLAEGLCMLFERGLIERQGLSIFSRFFATSSGLSVLA